MSTLWRAARELVSLMVSTRCSPRRSKTRLSDHVPGERKTPTADFFWCVVLSKVAWCVRKWNYKISYDSLMSICQTCFTDSCKQSASHYKLGQEQAGDAAKNNNNNKKSCSPHRPFIIHCLVLDTAESSYRVSVTWNMLFKRQWPFLCVCVFLCLFCFVFADVFELLFKFLTQ